MVANCLPEWPDFLAIESISPGQYRWFLHRRRLGQVHQQRSTAQGVPDPYGVATVARHVYQSPQGGKTYCPLDRDARIVVSSTPRFAKMIAHKYAEFGSGRVLLDLEENHGRKVARSFVQNVADAVAAVALAKEESWNYALPEMEHPVTTITLGLDGTCLLMCEDGWRETMVGTIGFYDKAGQRQHTISMAATPEYGKATFLDHVGIADGARENWDWV